MSLKRIDSVYLKRRKALTRNGVFGCLFTYSLGCIVVLIALCQMPVALAAMEDKSELNEIRKEGASVLGDSNYKLDGKYWPIYGSPRGKRFYLHYCLPGFIPLEQGQCQPGKIPGSDPASVQVEYEYTLGSREVGDVGLEGSPAFMFPFQVNVNLNGKTPYFDQYNKMFEISKWKSHKVVKGSDVLQGKYVGLIYYESPAMPGGWWVPKDLSEYQTKLGNPPIFVCGSDICYLTIDQRNGWVATAKFNNAALSDWRALFVQLNESINIIMEQ